MGDLTQISMEDTAALNAATASLLAPEATSAPTIDPQPSGFVRLAGGLVRGLDVDEVDYEAEVGELDGNDEEFVDRVREAHKERVFNAIVERGTKTIGGVPATAATIKDLLIGDAEVLYLEIAKATYGDGIEYYGWTCPCGENLDITINYSDIPVDRLKNSADRLFDVPLRNGRVAHCRLPIVADVQFVQDAETAAEGKTALVARCTLAITEKSGSATPVSGDFAVARSLGQMDRNRIASEIGKRRVGPNYTEVTFKHDSCGKESPFPISMGDLFPAV